MTPQHTHTHAHFQTLYSTAGSYLAVHTRHRVAPRLLTKVNSRFNRYHVGEISGMVGAGVRGVGVGGGRGEGLGLRGVEGEN